MGGSEVIKKDIKEDWVRLRISPAKKIELEVQAQAKGFESVSAYIRWLISKDK
jgi:hypothetical protein